jgi:hypothetical protein
MLDMCKRYLNLLTKLRNIQKVVVDAVSAEHS